MTNRNGGTITWTSYNKPKQINQTGSNCAGDCTTQTYGPDRQLIKEVTKTGGVTTTLYYIGPHFEKEVSGVVTRYRSHVLVNGQAVYTQVEATGSWVAYYNLRDHLGSVDKQSLAVGTDTNPRQYSFDAFGKRRGSNWMPDNNDALQSADFWNHRGYTDHEHLDTVRLIYMRGRVFDPKLGRFISADPLLGQLVRPQSLNPYSYVGNRPLSAIDPSGFAPYLPLLPVDSISNLRACGAVECIVVTAGNGEAQLVGVDPATTFGSRGVDGSVGVMAADYTNGTAFENYATRVSRGVRAVAREFMPGAVAAPTPAPAPAPAPVPSPALAPMAQQPASGEKQPSDVATLTSSRVQNAVKGGEIGAGVLALYGAYRGWKVATEAARALGPAADLLEALDFVPLKLRLYTAAGYATLYSPVGMAAGAVIGAFWPTPLGTDDTFETNDWYLCGAPDCGP